jgi:hypothetical protein
MVEAILGAPPLLLAIFGVWLFTSHHVRINRALSSAAKELDLTFVPSRNIFKKKTMHSVIDGYKCEVLVFGRTAGKQVTNYVRFSAYFPTPVRIDSEIDPGTGNFSGAKETRDGSPRQNQVLIESAREKLKRPRVEADGVSSTSVLFIKYYRSEEIVRTMREVLQLTKHLS